MVEDANEVEWRRHLLTALDGVAKRGDDNTNEHVLIRAEIAELKAEVAALKGANPDKKIDDHIIQGRAWRMAIVGEVVAIIVLICSFIWQFSALTTIVKDLTDTQAKISLDVDDLKLTSVGYREFRTQKEVKNGSN